MVVKLTHHHGRGIISVWEKAFEIPKLRRIEIDDVVLVRMFHQVILMIVFSGIETLKRADLCDDWRTVRLHIVQLCNIGLPDLLLRWIGIENL